MFPASGLVVSPSQVVIVVGPVLLPTVLSTCPTVVARSSALATVVVVCSAVLTWFPGLCPRLAAALFHVLHRPLRPCPPPRARLLFPGLFLLLLPVPSLPLAPPLAPLVPRSLSLLAPRPPVLVLLPLALAFLPLPSASPRSCPFPPRSCPLPFPRAPALCPSRAPALGLPRAPPSGPLCFPSALVSSFASSVCLAPGLGTPINRVLTPTERLGLNRSDDFITGLGRSDDFITGLGRSDDLINASSTSGGSV